MLVPVFLCNTFKLRLCANCAIQTLRVLNCCCIDTVLHTSRLCLHPSHQGSGSGSGAEMFQLLQAKNVARPQLKFKEKVDNSNTPFIPKIFIKPNALKPLPSCRTYIHPYVLPIFCFRRISKRIPSSLADFTNKQIRKERPEDLDVPAALADFIHQQRTQEHVEDMYGSRRV